MCVYQKQDKNYGFIEINKVAEEIDFHDILSRQAANLKSNKKNLKSKNDSDSAGFAKEPV